MSLNQELCHSRPHRKSRFGCKVCKARKIKCDEIRPVCGNCTKRFANAEEECIWGVCSSANSPQASGRVAVEPSPSPSLQLNPVHSAHSHVSRSLELRLFHHFSTSTSLSMPFFEEPTGLNMWSMHVPAIAFDCEYVYHAILGITALHILPSDPDNASLRTAAFHYIDLALSQHRPELSQITRANSEPLIVASILLAMHAKLRSRCLLPSSVTPYTLPLSYFYLQEGVNQLWHATDSYIQGSVLQAYLNLKPEPDDDGYAVWTTPMQLSPGDVKAYRNPSPESSRDERQFSLEEWEELLDDPSFFIDFKDPEISPETRAIYEGMMEILMSVKDAIHARERHHWIRRQISAMPTQVPLGFVELLEKEDGVAIALLARFFGLMKFVDDAWWLRGTPEFELQGLLGMMGGREDGEQLMEWPWKILVAC